MSKIRYSLLWSCQNRNPKLNLYKSTTAGVFFSCYYLFRHFRNSRILQNNSTTGNKYAPLQYHCLERHLRWALKLLLIMYIIYLLMKGSVLHFNKTFIFLSGCDKNGLNCSWRYFFFLKIVNRYICFLFAITITPTVQLLTFSWTNLDSFYLKEF